MPKPKLTFYFDLHSPYAYLAYQFIRVLAKVISARSPTLTLGQRSEAFRACEIHYVPTHLVGLAKAGIANPPWSVPNKVDYMWRDVARWAQEFRIPWRSGLPANYPKARTSDVQRALVACLEIDAQRLPEVLDALYPAFWVDKESLQAPEVFEPALERVLGRDMTRDVVALSRSEEIRNKLRQNTTEAIESGATGLPWFIAERSSGDKDVFWGFDHLGLVQRFLRLPEEISAHL